MNIDKTGVTVNPDEVTFNDAVALLVDDPLYLEARSFYDGDHWQKGKAWIGPRMDEESEEGAEVMDGIKASLVTHPAIEEISERHKDAVTTEPTWNITVRRRMAEDEQPDTAEQALIDELEAALTAWWDDKEALLRLQEAVIDLQLGGRGLLRLMVPEGMLEVGEDGQVMVPAGGLEDQLDRIWPVQVYANEAEVYRDPTTMRQIGVYVYEVADIITGKMSQIAEVTYLTPDGKTAIRVLRAGQGASGATLAPPETVELDLGGRLPLYKMEGKRLITGPVLSNQKLLNMDLTMLGKNTVLGGFLERVILNGQPPGDWVLEEDGTKKFVKGEYKVGAGTTNWITGAVVGYDPETRDPIMANPSVVYRDPVSPDTFTKTQDATYKTILQAARQLHVIMSSASDSSGELLKQARADYAKSLMKTKTKVDAMGKWLLEGTAALAAALMGQPGRYKELRVNFDSQLDLGPLNAEDRNSMLNEVNSSIRSRENYMVVASVTKDPAAERRKILEEAEAGLPGAGLPGAPQGAPGQEQKGGPGSNRVPGKGGTGPQPNKSRKERGGALAK